jgi:large subunit ribosomal protein L30
MAAKVEIRLARSVIHSLPAQRRTVRSLGLRRIGSRVVHELTPSIQGMVRVVAHLVEVKEIK